MLQRPWLLCASAALGGAPAAWRGAAARCAACRRPCPAATRTAAGGRSRASGPRRPGAPSPAQPHRSPLPAGTTEVALGFPAATATGTGCATCRHNDCSTRRRCNAQRDAAPQLSSRRLSNGQRGWRGVAGKRLRWRPCRARGSGASAPSRVAAAARRPPSQRRFPPSPSADAVTLAHACCFPPE